MNYYELFGLEPRLNLDLQDLEARYHELSRKYHPDFHTTSSLPERAEALEMTARLNDAYRTLRNPTRRAEYLVRSAGLTVDSSKVPQSLLMEVFEINEAIDELRTARAAGDDETKLAAGLDEVRAEIAARKQAFRDELDRSFVLWDELVTAKAPAEPRQAQLAEIADILARASYIRNLEAELNDEVSP